MEGGLSGTQRRNADIADNLQLWVVGYNFCCMIASDTLFDSRP